VRFDIIEVSNGFLSMCTDDLLGVVEKPQKGGLRAKPEVGIQYGAARVLFINSELKGREILTSNPPGQALPDAGCDRIMIKSEGITRERQDLANGRPGAHRQRLDRVMSKRRIPLCYVVRQELWPDVNLFVNHSQNVQLQCLRVGIWDVSTVWVA
jgi:phosphosulfolactate synthase (CoM biosynthesis protein A)